MLSKNIEVWYFTMSHMYKDKSWLSSGSWRNGLNSTSHVSTPNDDDSDNEKNNDSLMKICEKRPWNKSRRGQPPGAVFVSMNAASPVIDYSLKGYPYSVE